DPPAPFTARSGAQDGRRTRRLCQIAQLFMALCACAGRLGRFEHQHQRIFQGGELQQAGAGALSSVARLERGALRAGTIGGGVLGSRRLRTIFAVAHPRLGSVEPVPGGGAVAVDGLWWGHTYLVQSESTVYECGL